MKRILTAAVIGMAGTTAVLADEFAGWNAGVAAAFAEYDFESSELDDSSLGLKLFTGYRFNKWLGLEGAYHNFGDFESDLVPVTPGGDLEVSLSGYSGSALLFLPWFSDKLDVYAKAGYYAFDQDAVIDGGLADSNSPDGFLAGLGARYKISDQFAFRYEGEWFDIDDGQLWVLNAGIEYLFGRPARPAPVAMAAPAAPPPAAAAPPPPPPPPPPADSDGDGVTDDKDACPGTPAGAKVDARGCEEELILRGVTFETSSATLTAQDRMILDSVADILAQRPAFNVNVVGHTDSTGSDAYNQPLSERRAAAVRDYLVSRGIPREKLTSTGRGSSEPIAPNDTAEGRSLNRRVTLEFSEN